MNAGLDAQTRWAARLAATEARLGLSEGWQLLYCPWALPVRARVWFVSLNPAPVPPGTPLRRVSDEAGCSLLRPPLADHSPIIGQFRALAAFLGMAPEAIAWGVAAPFRSRRWHGLPPPAREAALTLGRAFWAETLARGRPRLIVTAGAIPARLMTGLLGASPEDAVASGWGATRLSRHQAGGTMVVALPHLSSYRLFSRPDCAVPLARIFERAT